MLFLAPKKSQFAALNLELGGRSSPINPAAPGNWRRQLGAASAGVRAAGLLAMLLHALSMS